MGMRLLSQLVRSPAGLHDDMRRRKLGQEFAELRSTKTLAAHGETRIIGERQLKTDLARSSATVAICVFMTDSLLRQDGDSSYASGGRRLCHHSSGPINEKKSSSCPASDFSHSTLSGLLYAFDGFSCCWGHSIFWSVCEPTTTISVACVDRGSTGIFCRRVVFWLVGFGFLQCTCETIRWPSACLLCREI